MLAGVHQFGGADLAALIDYYPARGRPDLDNRLKPLLDALEHAGIYDNDRQIDDLRIRRKHNVKGGRVIVQLWRISDVRD